MLPDTVWGYVNSPGLSELVFCCTQWCGCIEIYRITPSSEISNSMYPLQSFWPWAAASNVKTLIDHKLSWQLPSWLVHKGGPWGGPTASPRGDGNKQSSLKSRPTQRLTVLKPNTSNWGHQIPGRPATGKGPGTRLGSSPAMNSDDSHVCNTPWYIKFDSRQPQAMWKTFFNVCFCGGSWMLFLQRY